MCDKAISDPMSFLYLDMLSTILLNDTTELVAEFDTKMRLVIEYEQNCLENAKQLFFIDQFVDTLKQCVFQTEQELQENEIGLLEAEKFITEYESSLSSRYIDIQDKHSSYLAFLKLLLSADRSAAQCNQLKEDIVEYNNMACKYLEPSKSIAKIIDYHNKALNMMEERINDIELMTKEVATNYNEISKKLQITSLTTKFTCDMANVINDIFQK